MLQGLTRKVRGWLHGAETVARTGGGSTRTGDSVVPDAARRLYETGVELLRNGNPSAALAPLDEAIAAHPGFVEAHIQAGVALRDLGMHEEALARFQRALEARHDDVPAINHQGIAFLDLQRYEEAADSFKLALAYDPGSTEACVHLAMACWNLGRVDAAVAHFRRALELDSGLARARIMLARLLHAEGRLDEALESYRQALALDPGIPELQLNCGLTLLKLGRADEATVCLEKALALNPDFPEGYFNLGNARREQNRKREAIECYERAVGLKPDYADAYTNLGALLKEQGEVDRALECYRRATSLDPASVEPHHNMGLVFNQLGGVREAIACYEAAQRVSPGHPESQLNLAITRLEMGDFQRGWEGYECRFRQTNPELGAHVRAFPYPRWDGQPLAGRRILVWGEQGIGDEILFAALYREIVATARSCTIECAAKLVALFSRSFAGAQVVARGDPPHPDTAHGYDYQCPAGSLARWLRPELASFPAGRGYLDAAPGRVAYWKSRLAQLGNGLKVGFSWRSTNLKGDRPLYCTRLDQWEAILCTPGAEFVCLQYDECREELARARERFGVTLHAFPEVDLYDDLDEAAALTQALDLVISAPTAVSLLSAALGVPTWQMTYGADWQVHGTDHNPWFPAMTQFKRAWNEEWEAVIAVIARRLRERTSAAMVGAAAGTTANVAAATTADVSAVANPAGGDVSRSVELALGKAFLRDNRLMEARAQFEQHIAREPRSAEAWLGLARAMRGLDRPQDAAEGCQRAIELDPGLAEAALELGIARYQQGRLEESNAAFDRVLRLDPGHVAARLNRALVSYQRGEIDAAIAGYEAVLGERPEHPEARFNLGLALLARGEFARGWQEYEWRFDQATVEDRNRSFPFPRWEGEDPASKTILVWKEQSVGGQILFAGMLPELIVRAGYCIVECTPKLVPLFARSFPECDVVPRSEPPHPFTQQAIDFQIPLGGLGRWLRRSLDEFPRREAYLTPDPDRVEYWKERLRQVGPGPKVGFGWRSINVRGERSLACTLIEQWEPVLKTRGAVFVSLQYDECSDELDRARRQFGVPVHALSGIDMFNDLDEVAALMRALDLVISAPTAVSVLSAALGVPTWQLHHGTDWQMHGAPGHPWLRSLRRFQRGLYQPWEEVMDEVAAGLRRWLAVRGVHGG